MAIDLNTLTSELQNSQENERHLTALLNNERQTVESKSRALRKCEGVLKVVVENNDDLKHQNESLNREVRVFIFFLIKTLNIFFNIRN